MRSPMRPFFVLMTNLKPPLMKTMTRKARLSASSRVCCSIMKPSNKATGWPVSISPNGKSMAKNGWTEPGPIKPSPTIPRLMMRLGTSRAMK